MSAPTTTATAVLDQLAGARERYFATFTTHYDDIRTDITARASDTGALETVADIPTAIRNDHLHVHKAKGLVSQ